MTKPVLRLCPRLVSGVLVSFVLGSSGTAQEPDVNDDKARIGDVLGKDEQAAFQHQSVITLKQEAQGLWPPTVQEAYWKRAQAEQEYWMHSWGHRERAFQWQHTSSIVLFWIVMITTLVGLAMAGYQFAKDKPALGVPPHTLEISKGGLKLSSSFAGIVVLAMSLGFLYLYLNKVYGIRLLREAGEPAPQSANARAGINGTYAPPR